MERLVFVSEETTTRGKRLYQMQANGTLLFMAINLNDSFTNSKPGLTVLHQRNSYVNLNDLFNPHNRPGSHPKQVHVALVGKNYMKVSGVTKESGASSTVEL